MRIKINVRPFLPYDLTATTTGKERNFNQCADIDRFLLKLRKNLCNLFGRINLNLLAVILGKDEPAGSTDVNVDVFHFVGKGKDRAKDRCVTLNRRGSHWLARVVKILFAFRHDELDVVLYMTHTEFVQVHHAASRNQMCLNDLTIEGKSTGGYCNLELSGKILVKRLFKFRI